MERRPQSNRQKAQRLGHIAEWVCANYLRTKGYSIIAGRFKTKVGEVDIIARRRDVLVFVEVKFRQTTDEAIRAVTPASQKRIGRAAQAFIARNGDAQSLGVRYDVIAMGRWRLVHLRDAWRDKN